jgi:KDO2-lipid IV(A) lauroyltransferase
MKNSKSKKLFHPRYWLTWLSFFLWWLIAQIPYSLQRLLSKFVGRLMVKFARRRVAIATRNIQLCFANLDTEEQKKLVEQHIASLGMSFFEIGMAWFWSKKRLANMVTYEGLEHLKTAEKNRTGVLLMTIHYTHLDLGAAFVGLQHSIDGSYRRHKNPVYDLIQRNRRERFNADAMAIERDDVRSMVKQLRRGRPVWYAPDQDYRSKNNIFIPFFGVPANYITATSQLARMGHAQVIPYTCVRKPEGGYHIKVLPPLENFPSDDLVADTKRINQIIEESILLAPEQYLWVHRRFKTRPEGEPDLYAAAGIAKGKRR